MPLGFVVTYPIHSLSISTFRFVHFPWFASFEVATCSSLDELQMGSSLCVYFLYFWLNSGDCSMLCTRKRMDHPFCVCESIGKQGKISKGKAVTGSSFLSFHLLIGFTVLDTIQ